MHYYTTNLLSDFIAKNILKKSIPDIETFIISQSKTQSSISDKKFQKQFFLALNQIFWQCVKIAPLSFNSNSAEKSESGHFFLLNKYWKPTKIVIFVEYYYDVFTEKIYQTNSQHFFSVKSSVSVSKIHYKFNSAPSWIGR